LLPAPLHNTPAFLRARFLEFADKDAIARAMLRLIGGLPEDTAENFLLWLQRHGQTERAIERFWKPVLVSALNEDLDRMSVRYAAQVFRESFLKSASAGAMGVPRVPLTELYSAAGDYIRARSGEVLLRRAVDSVAPAERGVVLRTGGEQLEFDSVILAVPFDQLSKMLPSASGELPAMLTRLEHSPITGIHLWFDRPVTDLPHAVLLERTIQWMFNKTILQERDAEGNKSYLELVVSSSKSLVARSRQEIIDLAVGELAEFFPAAREAKLEKATVIKEIHATYSAQPLSDRYRPASKTAWPGIFLAGDWTATGWPATMEGAVRSGYMAAEALAHAAGIEGSALVPDLKASGLMRWFG
ncbi:MAG TPA: hydroxysqualene dehydroxylase HpnE, partial [Terriglobales bacterium]|nr:hydroxysqualene dehydroxylase HpnE [Terriglobales bacterium]